VQGLLEIKGELSTKQILRLVLPLLFEQVVLLALPVINAILVSSAGQAALSGVSLVDLINGMLSYLFLFAMSGISIVAAQYFGRNDTDNLRHSIQQAFIASNIISVAVTVLMFLFSNSVIGLFMHGADMQIMVQAKNYFRILLFACPFFSFYSICVASLRGTGNTRLAMIVSITQNTLTVAFSSVLIYVFGLGVYGAAIGMIAGRAAGAVIGAFALRRSKIMGNIRDMFSFKIDVEMQKRILSFGFPQSVEMIFYFLGKVIINMFILQAGIDQVAANAAAFPVTDFLTFGVSGFLVIATTTVAYAKGAHDDILARKYLRKVFWMVCAGSVACALIMIPLLPKLLTLYHLSDVSFGLAWKIAVLQALMLILFFPAGFLLPAGFRGAGDVVAPTVASMVAVWCVRLPVAFLFAYVLQMGAVGIWIGMWADFLFRSVFFLVRWRSGKWLKFKSV
jgi:putative MATE family efflux protein